MGQTKEDLVLAQLALISDRVPVLDAQRWYERILGFVPTAWTDRFGGPDLSYLQKLSDPDAKLTIAWLVDQNAAFQLELFEFERPRSTPRPAGWTLRDVGYSMAVIHVRDFPGTLDRASSDGSLVRGPDGPAGDRRALVTDPNGVVLEVLERDIPAPGAGSRARPNVNVAIRAVTASVPSLEKSVAFFGATLGLTSADDVGLHSPEHMKFLGLEDADHVSQVFVAGGLFLELIEFRNPPGAPWPSGHQLSDAGVMNIALATISREVYLAMRDRVVAAGYEARDFVPSEHVEVSYVTDDQGFSVELLFMAPEAYDEFGFTPHSAQDEAVA